MHIDILSTPNVTSYKVIDWQTWLKHGDQYLNATTPKGEKNRFNGETRYNLLSMSLESYIMAILDYFHTLPDNHTYTDLLTALDTVLKIDDDLKNRILKYENIQSICSIEKYHRNPPSEEELVDLKGAIKEIRQHAHQVCVS